jgi:hypothetical protein
LFFCRNPLNLKRTKIQVDETDFVLEDSSSLLLGAVPNTTTTTIFSSLIIGTYPFRKRSYKRKKTKHSEDKKNETTGNSSISAQVIVPEEDLVGSSLSIPVSLPISSSSTTSSSAPVSTPTFVSAPSRRARRIIPAATTTTSTTAAAPTSLLGLTTTPSSSVHTPVDNSSILVLTKPVSSVSSSLVTDISAMASIIGSGGPVLEPHNTETVVIDVAKEVKNEETKNGKEKVETKTDVVEKNENEETGVKSEEENKMVSNGKNIEQSESQKNKISEEEVVREKEEETRTQQEREERERQAAAALFGNPLSTEGLATDVSKNLVESAISSLIGGAPAVTTSTTTTDVNPSSSSSSSSPSSSSSVMSSFVQAGAVGDESGENVGEGTTDEPSELNKPDDSLFEDGKDVGIDENFISEMVGGVKKKRGKKGKKGKK